MTQGVDLGESATRDGSSGRELTEWREAGKTGEPGWTKTAKMPQWESREPADDRKQNSKPTTEKPKRRGNG